MGDVSRLKQFQESAGEKGWQLGVIGQIRSRLGSQMMDYEREALVQVHLVFAVAEYEALMALHITLARKTWKIENEKNGGPVGAWEALALKAFENDWSRFNEVPWAHAKDGDPPTIVAWLKGLFEMRNQIVHPEPRKGWEERLRNAGLPLTPRELGDEYMERFCALRTKVEGTFYWLDQRLRKLQTSNPAEGKQRLARLA